MSRRPLSSLRTAFVRLAAASAVLVAAGCAHVAPAQMALPPALAGSAPEAVSGLGSGRSGPLTLGPMHGSFERGRDRLELFNALSFDRASTRYRLTRADGSAVAAACRGRQTSLTVGIVGGHPRPFNVECQWTGAVTAQLTLAAPSWVPGTRAEREGRFSSDGMVLELRSVHRVQGSPLPLEAPIGYLISHQGQPVGAIELNGRTPRLWRPDAASPLHEPVTLAALALGLLWDPAELGR